MHLQRVSTQLILRSSRRLACAETFFCFCVFSAYAKTTYVEIYMYRVSQCLNPQPNLRFNYSERETFEKNCKKRRQCCNPVFFLF